MASPAELKEKGVLAINRRNAEYILPINPRQFYPRVDDKMLTKELCHPHNIPVPETFGVVKLFGQLKELPEMLKGLTDFVIKPASGAGGRGVIVIVETCEQGFKKADGTLVTLQDIRYHVSSILSGLFSLGGQPDQAIIESRIVRHPVFDSIAVGGTPDIRVIVYKGVPVMAMLRLPTLISGGRANLHQGAIGAGVHLGTGLTSGGVWKNRAISTHPETEVSIVGIQVPFWDIIIQTSTKLYEILELGYYGVDFVLDVNKGPIILEANARPGLAIQIANRIGLTKRLQFVDSKNSEKLPVSDRIALINDITEIK
jgi:alpha-L-glutamate ligase-like protein